MTRPNGRPAMGWAGMKEYSKEAWAFGCTTVSRGKAVNYTQKSVINPSTEAFPLLHTQHSHPQAIYIDLMWIFLEETGVELKFVSVFDGEIKSQSRWNVRSGCRTGNLGGNGRTLPGTWRWSPDFLCWWNPPRTSQFHWQETLELDGS